MFEGDELPAKARRDLVPIEREGSLDEDLLEDSSNRISEYLRGQGYRDAQAPYTKTPRNGELAVVFRVTKGRAVPHREGVDHGDQRDRRGRADAETFG